MENTKVSRRLLRWYIVSSFWPAIGIMTLFWTISKLIGFIDNIRIVMVHGLGGLPWISLTGLHSLSPYTYKIILFFLGANLYMAYNLLRIMCAFKNGPDSGNKVEVSVNFERNPNLVNSFLSILVSLGSLFGITDATIPTLAVVIIILILLFYMIKISTDYYPNVTLALIGWRGILASQNNDKVTAPIWVFYRNKEFKEGKVLVRYFGATQSGLKIGVIDSE